ncbi:TIGR04211 family SH3 domain-containing protein [Agarivorans sp. MS3-6]|uniref:TIGR04211 family SH3 domain-containing protein n=1 Tax=Agarivorans sp. TSD2052 TaxID=2937286 RepID=UPI00200D6AAE|nr:TIGR04211 family SH3 domain-containing protein [Agarivorans sp. TSD2052]UPW19381.1 TIGR04211 family SH3 domain-containing protein [Agarivorans sp. TSD2052]
MIVRNLSAAVLSLALAFPVIAQTRYISDDLFIFLHSGPSNQFRILGSVNAGTKINQVDYNAENKYAKVVLENGREGWVEAKYLNRTPGLAAQLQQVKTQLETSENQRKQQLEDSGNATAEQSAQIEAQAVQIEQLQVTNDQLNEQLNQISEQNSSLQHELDTKDEAVQMQWFMRGGAVAGIGLLLGVLLPMIPRRKKRDQQWM